MNLDRITAGLEDAIAFKKGDTTRGVAHVPETIDVSAIRSKLGMTQEVFAKTFALSVDTVRDWEQGRRHPHGPARVLLTVIAKRPDAVKEALEHESDLMMSVIGRGPRRT